MKITISDDKKIAVVQKEFNQHYPYLKLEFFSRAHKKGDPSPKALMKSSSVTIGELAGKHRKGEIIISKNHTVAQVEGEFEEIFGLHVQVFRKSGKIWLETTATDSWTLQRQNAEGEELSKPVEADE